MPAPPPPPPAAAWLLPRVALAWAVALGLLLTPAAAQARPLLTGLQDPELAGAEGALAGERMRAAGATFARVPLRWSAVARRAPADAADPADPAYDWRAPDREIAAAVAAGLRPVVVIFEAPMFARPGGGRSNHPDLAAYEAFSRAAARRYAGTDGGPRVRDWQVWNEPNLNHYLVQEGVGDAAAVYAAMIERAAAAVKGVHPDNLVIAGGMGPFSRVANGDIGTPALEFTRRVLCLSGARKPRPRCDRRLPADVWSHHPYTSGGPAHRAAVPGDVSLGDLGQLFRLVRAGERAGQVRAAGRLRLWVTEFAWDTAPPDPGGVPSPIHARWVAEGLYRMWRSGAEAVIWFGLRDRPRTAGASWGQTFQSGLWARRTPSLTGDRPKPSLRAFRFPFVALPAARGVRVWGRTPDGAAGRVVVEQRSGARWRRVATLAADRDGIFQRVLRLRSKAVVRARSADDTAQPFAPVATRDRAVNPFGGTQRGPVTPAGG